MDISTVVPVYNAEKTLPKLVARLRAVLAATGRDFEVILIDDGSRDSSWKIIRKLSGEDPRIRGISLMRNYGQHNALREGIMAARGDVIVTLDDDLQNPPEEIPKLLEKLEEGYDVVYGIPAQKRHNLWRRAGSSVVRLILSGALGAEIAGNISSFRALRSPVRAAFSGYRGAFIIIDAPLAWATNRFGSVTVRHQPREESESNYNFRRLLFEALNALFGFSVRPLKFASLLGFCLTFFGAGVLAYAVGRYLILGYSIPGFPFLASIIAIFSGAQLLVLGITGEYLSRMYFRTMGRPGSIVRSTTNSGETILNS
ncbi:MAG: glycosyltransferase family 2 protein [Candidatus Erginobacter occultus]|nr:glycosyltransferase family 2 protein [Candidatus Erginobacter occultus]